MDMPRRLGAEFFGTFWLTFAGCGSAVLAAGFPALGIGFLGVSLAFGLTVLTMAMRSVMYPEGISIVRSQSGSGLQAASRRVT
jgi:glycerol uptake facilitator-like aquaporin